MEDRWLSAEGFPNRMIRVVRLLGKELLPHIVLFVLFRPAPISVIPATSGITQSAERNP